MAKLGKTEFRKSIGTCLVRNTDFCKVLGGLLVIVGTIAIVAKVMKWRKLLRFETHADEQAERGLIPVDTMIDLPFGVKALDGGSPIEGVWNARTATPLHGPRSRNRSPLIQASRILRRSKRDPSISSIPSLDIGEPSSGVASAQARAVSPPRDMSTLPPPSTRPRCKKSSSITINYSGPSTRTKPAPTAMAPESSKCPQLEECGAFSYQTDPPATPSIAKLKVRGCPKKSSTSRRFVIGGRSSPNKSALSKTDGNDVITRMEAHRRLHSAESGQLIPKTRRKSEDNARINAEYCVREEGDAGGRIVSWPTGENIKLTTARPPKLNTISQPSAEPQVGIIDSRASSRHCPSAWTSRMQEQLDEKLVRQVSITDSLDGPPSLCSDTTLSTAVTGHEPGAIANTATRKVNDGFEVLPAGTFDKEPDAKVLSLWPGSFKENAEGPKRANRLQKHNRSSSGSSRHSRSSTETRRSGQFAILHAVY